MKLTNTSLAAVGALTVTLVQAAPALLTGAGVVVEDTPAARSIDTGATVQERRVEQAHSPLDLFNSLQARSASGSGKDLFEKLKTIVKDKDLDWELSGTLPDDFFQKGKPPHIGDLNTPGSKIDPKYHELIKSLVEKYGKKGSGSS